VTTQTSGSVLLRVAFSELTLLQSITKEVLQKIKCNITRMGGWPGARGFGDVNALIRTERYLC
jgi:hypothetical protein